MLRAKLEAEGLKCQKKHLTFILGFIILTFAWISPVSAVNDSPVKISNVEISVMPEYDNSDVLVLYGINFVNNSVEPYNGELRFPVPKATTNNIVKETANPNDVHVEVRIEEKGDYAEFVWKPANPIQPNSSYPIHLEYYYNPIPGTGTKSFEYQFRAAMPVDQAIFNVYQPLKASNFKMEPVGQLSGPDEQGFQVQSISSANLKIGDKVDLKVSYTKDDPNPSVQPQSAGTEATSETGQTSAGELSSTVIIVAIVAIVAVVVLIGFIIFSNQNEEGDESQDSESEFAQKKRRLKQRLENGNISEETYLVLIDELEREHS